MVYEAKGYIVVGREGCFWCDKTVALLEKKGLQYSYVLIDHNKWVITLMREASYTTVPLIFGPDNKVIGGYTELEALLKDKESKT